VRRKAIYAGTFDPVTNGHLDLIERGQRVFRDLIVAVAENPSKEPLFTLEERVGLLRQAAKKWKRVTIEAFDGLLVDFTRSKKTGVILRGLRAVSDFEYEFQMALMNRKLSPDVEIVYMMPSEVYSYVSSSLVKEVVARGGSVKAFVPGFVEKALRQKLRP